jgi:16S rRNA (uracil1498-N3)-methyltransferase
VSAPHFFVDPETHPGFDPGEHVRLSSEDSRHAIRSLRLRPGDRMTVSNTAGAVAIGILRDKEGGAAIVEVESVDRFDPPRPGLSVAMAPPKGDRLSWATQKVAELGVDDLVLLGTTRSVRQAGAHRANILDRQRAIARQAAMQSRQPFLMTISESTFDGFVRTRDTASKLLLSERSTRRLSTVDAGSPSSIALLVGPEGGFTEDEVDTARHHGFVDVSLGPSILRIETAAVVGAALVFARYGRLG